MRRCRSSSGVVQCDTMISNSVISASYILSLRGKHLVKVITKRTKGTQRSTKYDK